MEQWLFSIGFSDLFARLQAEGYSTLNDLLEFPPSASDLQNTFGITQVFRRNKFLKSIETENTSRLPPIPPTPDPNVHPCPSHVSGVSQSFNSATCNNFQLNIHSDSADKFLFEPSQSSTFSSTTPPYQDNFDSVPSRLYTSSYFQNSTTSSQPQLAASTTTSSSLLASQTTTSSAPSSSRTYHSELLGTNRIKLSSKFDCNRTPS